MKTSVMGTKVIPSEPGKYSAPKLLLVSLLPLSESLPCKLSSSHLALFSATAEAVSVLLCKLA
jgi:hypothetical protein